MEVEIHRRDAESAEEAQRVDSTLCVISASCGASAVNINPY
jgi:hypothetical protein